jgi:hypothetical protein
MEVVIDVLVTLILLKILKFHRMVIINEIYQETVEGDMIYDDGIIPNVDHVALKSNNDNNNRTSGPNFNVLQTDSTQLDQQMLAPLPIRVIRLFGYAQSFLAPLFILCLFYLSSFQCTMLLLLNNSCLCFCNIPTSKLSN